MTAQDQASRAGTDALDVDAVRADFPILARTVRGGSPLVYLDSANTSQKPRQVIDTLTEFYERHNANIHRATHELGEEATEAYEGARIKVARFIGTPDETEVIFTKNVSEAINLVAYSIGNATAGRAARLRRCGYARATRSSSPRWSITPTSCPGSCCASGQAHGCAGSA